MGDGSSTKSTFVGWATVKSEDSCAIAVVGGAIRYGATCSRSHENRIERCIKSLESMKTTSRPLTKNDLIEMHKTDLARNAARKKLLLDVHESDIKSMEVIASGSQGTVYEVELKNDPETVYAMKIWKKEFSEEKKMREVSFLKKLVGIPHIVKIHGTVFDSLTNTRRPIGFIMDFFRKGSLSEMIYDEPERNYDYKTILGWIVDISTGLQCMHDENIVHADVNPKNIALNENLEAVLVDFAGCMPTGTDEEPCQGTIQYMCPEVMKYEGTVAYTPACDVYSVSITAWEMIHRRVPFGFPASALVLSSRIRNGDRPEFDDICPVGLRQIIQRCWSPNPNDRPSLQELKSFCLEEVARMGDDLARTF